MYIGVVGLGINKAQQTDTIGMVVIAEYSNTLEVGASDPKSIISQVLLEFS